jgi:hypothetical protein
MAFWHFKHYLPGAAIAPFGHHHHKATLISTLSFFSGIEQIWLPLAFASLVAARGYYVGLTIIGAATFVTASLLFSAAIVVWQRGNKAQA